MWEPGSGSGSASSSARGRASSVRGLLLLLTIISLCILLYKIWGPLLLISCALLLCVHACYSLLVSDSLLAPHTVVLLRHGRSLGLELAQTLGALFAQGLDKAKQLLKYFKRQYEERCRTKPLVAEEIQKEGKTSLYSISSKSKNLAENANPRNSELYHSFTLNGACNIGKTSTPLPRGTLFKKSEILNGGVNMFTPTDNTLAKNFSPSHSDNKQSTLNIPRNEDILYSSRNLSWNNSMTPKVKDKPEAAKAVQNVAGPLLTSSRYNMDPKLYTDISSPGLTSRLSKYAAEANNKLTHQSQYGTGQFPKVNLNASPIPLLSPKQIKARMPVTVRVAPPEMTNYSPPDSPSHQEKSKMYSSSDVRESKSSPSVVQVLKKMATKRHASREDIMLDLAKKQKAEQSYEDQLENLEEMMQKRARDESTTSEDELSPQTKSQRPTKRPKASSCHDILNSLSSSVNVYTGVKRKAMDSSRCSSPETEKHFKSSSRSPNRSSSLTVLTSKEVAKSKEQLNVRVPIANASGEPYQNKVKQKTPEISKLDNHSPIREQQQSPNALNLSTPKVQKESKSLTDKLFMKPDPQTNEKLKSLIEEQGKAEVQFKTDDKDEIKKQDIDNMRQNSMRLRLKSMFDAISGKSASKINPDVVIQAEEVNSPTTSSFATLNSSTTTTTVNTSPITTTIVPILKSDTDTKSPTTKHVTFNIPQSNSTLTTSSSSGLATISNAEATKPLEPKSLGTSNLAGFNATTTSAPMFSFSSNTTTASTSATSSSKPTTQSVPNGFSFSTSSNVAKTTPSVSEVNAKNPVSSISPALFAPKTTTEAAGKSSTTSGFSFSTTTAKTMSPSDAFAFTSTRPSASSLPLTSMTSSTPTFSFNSTTSQTAQTFSFNSTTSPVHSKSAEPNASTNSPVLNFKNPISKSPTSSVTAQKSSTIPSSLSNGVGSQPSSMFSSSMSNSPFSSSSNATSSSAVAPAASATVTTSAPPMFAFSADNKPATGGFSFNAASTTVASTTMFAFGSNTQSNANSSSRASTFPMPTTANTTMTASSSAFNSTPSLFNAPTNTSSPFSSSSALGSAPMFKSPTATTTSTTAASIFGTSSSGFGTTPALAATTTPSLFGNNAPVNSTPTTTIPSLFGNTATTSASTAPTMSPFGAPSTQQQSSSSIFAGAYLTTTSSIFGSANLGTGLFSGVNSAATNPVSALNPSESTSIFGQTKPLSFGGANSTFGPSTSSSGFSAPGMNNASSGSSAFQMTAAQTPNNPPPSYAKSTASFGAPTNASGSIFGSTTGGFGSPSTGAPPAFGSAITTTTQQPPAFGSTAPSGSFGSTAPSNSFGSNAPASSFGTGATSSAFGTGSSLGFGNPAATNSPFGASAPASTQPPTLFSNTTATSTTSGGSFSFGGAQPAQQPQQQQQSQQPQPQQQNATFGFGSSTNANAPSSGGGMFQFGGANAPKPAGFNFSAPTGAPSINFSGGAAAAAPPAFNAPPANMFSIGSGSSTPRSRTSRPRRQR